MFLTYSKYVQHTVIRINYKASKIHPGYKNDIQNHNIGIYTISERITPLHCGAAACSNKQ